MDDQQVHHRINELVDEEHRLERAHVGRPLSAPEKARLDAVEVELDRLWDLLRRRDSRRRRGLDEDEAQEQSAETVESYLQ